MVIARSKKLPGETRPAVAGVRPEANDQRNIELM
jgi:hypothetical protein